MSRSATLKILDDLIKFKSVAKDELDSLKYIETFLQNLGFKCYLKEFSDPNEVTTTNLYAEIGDNGPNLCFAGHTDVVPAGEGWSLPPFKTSIIDNKIYGRGLVDMKGAIACFLAATKNYLSHNKPNHKISFLLTGDEEGTGINGTKKMLEYIQNKNLKIDFCIVGEPTNEETIGDMAKIGRRGSINFDLTINGKQGHIAYPEGAINPNHILTRILNDLIQFKFDTGNADFLATQLQISSIDVGNSATNVVPSSANARFNVRFNNIHQSSDIIGIIEKICKNNSSDNFILTHRVSGESFLTKKNRDISDFLSTIKKVTNITPKASTTGGTSDARFIKDYAPLIEFGLLNKTAHQVDEHSNLDDLYKLEAVYLAFLEQYNT
jgi:succinyl-diaminopimelate desuccinylase